MSVILCIWDGWGVREEKNDPVRYGDAIFLANTPYYDALIKNCPNIKLMASGEYVGLPKGQMGNSEVGHMTIGAGRVIMQHLPRINMLLETGDFFQLNKFQEILERHQKKESLRLIQSKGETQKSFNHTKEESAVHILGIASDGGVHGHIDHLKAVAQYLASSGIRVHLHLMTDGRDTPPESALFYIGELEKICDNSAGAISIASISGRYYAMDRDNRHDRTALALKAILYGYLNQENHKEKSYGKQQQEGKEDFSFEGESNGCEKNDGLKFIQANNSEEYKNDPIQSLFFVSAIEYVEKSYQINTSDEFILPGVHKDYTGIKKSDTILCLNYRSDRIRQILSLLGDEIGSEKIYTICDTGLANLSKNILISSDDNSDNLGKKISDLGLKQLRLAETEKYPHVTFFFNGGKEEKYVGEDRILIPSPRVAYYDLQPEMSSDYITAALVNAVKSGVYDFICVNYANADMVGHTGNLEATIRACESLDGQLAKIIELCNDTGHRLILTSDHGNAEQMFDVNDGGRHTAHTTNKVPCIYYSSYFANKVKFYIENYRRDGKDFLQEEFIIKEEKSEEKYRRNIGGEKLDDIDLNVINNKDSLDAKGCGEGELGVIIEESTKSAEESNRDFKEDKEINLENYDKYLDFSKSHVLSSGESSIKGLDAKSYDTGNSDLKKYDPGIGFFSLYFDKSLEAKCEIGLADISKFVMALLQR